MNVKLIAAGIGLVLLLAAALYVQHLRADNTRLQTANATLTEANAYNVKAIEALQSEAAHTDKVLKQWTREKNELRQTQERLTAQIKEDLRNDEDFKSWAGTVMPDHVVGLLRTASSSVPDN